MSISAANLLPFNATNNPQNDTSTAGGGRMNTSQPSAWQADPASDTLAIISDQAGDTTQTVTTVARKDTGVVLSEAQTLNGVTQVLYTTLTGILRILSVTVSGITLGTVDVRKSTAAFTPFVRLNASGNSLFWTRLFGGASSDASVPLVRYDKMCWYNADALLAISPTFRLTSDPAAIIRQGIHTSINDVATIANRLTTPGGITFVDDNIDQVGPDLSTGSFQGVWWEQTAAAGAGPISNANSVFTSQMTVLSI